MRKRSAGLIFILLTVLTLSACSVAGEAVSLDLSCDYVIDARLDPHNESLRFIEEAHIRNEGTDSAEWLYFHLYGNAHKTGSEGITVSSVADGGGKPVEFKMLDDDRLIELKLNDPLGGGEELCLSFTCEAVIPVMESVYGISRDGEIQLPFFYPQLAVHDGSGFNSLYSAGDGRCTEVSDYQVTIEAPCEYELACTGTLLSRETADGRSSYVFRVESRRDIVIIAYTDYVLLERTVGDTTISGYFNGSKSRDAMEQVMDAAAFSMEYLGGIYMQYPYDTLIITNTGWSTRGFASMEYSGLFTVSMSDGRDVGNVENTYHEMAHQWFYSLVGNNEFTEPWLDESLAVFSAGLCFEAAGDGYSESYWLIQQLQANAAEGRPLNCSYKEAEQYGTLFYGNLFYGRGAIFLRELRDELGQAELLTVLSNYCKAYAHKIATTQDFLDILQANTASDVSGIIEKYIFQAA